MTAIMLRCAWPEPNLWQNRRPHWSARSKAVKAARTEAHGEALLRGIANIRGAERYRVTCEFYPPDNRRRDPHNFPATVKAHIDGIADALGVDDACFEVTWQTAHTEAPGAVLFIVEAAA